MHGDRGIGRGELERLPFEQLAQVHDRAARRELKSDGRCVESDDGKLGLLIEPDGRGAERELGAGVALCREAVTGHERPVGKAGGRGVPRALVHHPAFSVREASNALRRVERLTLGEARSRECENQQGGAQNHGDTMIGRVKVNGG